MLNFDIIAWGAIAAFLRTLKEYITSGDVQIIKSLYMMIAGVACAQLFTPEIISHLGLSETLAPSIAFVMGLLGKESVEIILKIDLKGLIAKFLPDVPVITRLKKDNTNKNNKDNKN